MCISESKSCISFFSHVGSDFFFFLFLGYQVCREWEATALSANKDVRVALIRIGVVLGKEGGALGVILYLFFCLPCYSTIILRFRSKIYGVHENIAIY